MEMRSREAGNLSYLSADRDLNSLISKKPKRTNGAKFNDLVISVAPTDVLKSNTTDRKMGHKKKKPKQAPANQSNSGKQSNTNLLATVHSSQVGSFHSSYGEDPS